MENLNTKKPNLAVRTADFITSKLLRGGAWAELADVVTGPQHSLGDAALQDTVEFEPVQPELPDFPHGLTLCDPVEHGWRYRSAEIPDQAA